MYICTYIHIYTCIYVYVYIYIYIYIYVYIYTCIHVYVDTYFEVSQAYQAHERALLWETSSHAWLANVRAIEISRYNLNSLISVSISVGVPVNGLHDTRFNELLQLRAEKKISSIL